MGKDQGVDDNIVGTDWKPGGSGGSRQGSFEAWIKGHQMDGNPGF